MADDNRARKLAPTDNAWPSSPPQQRSYIGARLFGRYRVEEIIGDGAAARVYRAHDEDDEGRAVALKVLRFELVGNKGMTRRFEREAHAAAHIDSPFVVQILDSGRLEDGTPWYAMELFEGSTIAELLDEHGCLPQDLVLRVALQIASGLAAAHARGIIHRDLKPENVAVTGYPETVKIFDFGIAKHTTLRRQTQPGEVFGTPEYMSPEQATGQHVDERSDIYSLGVMLYEMVCGARPFHASSHVKLVVRLMREECPPLSERAVVPPAFKALIMRCLAKSRDERFASMEELREALSRIQL